jgi:hypothetical protein
MVEGVTRTRVAATATLVTMWPQSFFRWPGTSAYPLAGEDFGRYPFAGARDRQSPARQILAA